jgi:hypothetical protein
MVRNFRSGWLGTLIAAALCVLFAAAPARAQGTSGQLPDPMSSKELTKFLRIYVQPTPEQTASIEKLHDAYLERFRQLRESDIEKFMAKTKTMQGSMPSKSQLDEFLKGYDRINKQIGEIDNSFFDALTALMGEARSQQVLRARDARTRAKARTGMVGGASAMYPTVDLAELTLELGLAAPELDAVQPALVAYEQRLTAVFKELGLLSIRMIRDMFEALEKTGFGGMSQEEMMADPERMQELMTAIQEVIAKAGERVQAKFKELGEFNLQTLGSLGPQLPESSRRELRNKFVRRAYPEIPDTSSGMESIFRRALRVQDQSLQNKEALRGAQAQWQLADDAMLDPMVSAAEEARAGRSLMDFSRGSSPAQDKLEGLATKRQELAISTLKVITPLASGERLKALIAKKIEAQESPGQFLDSLGEEDPSDPDAPESSVSVRASPIAPPRNFGGHSSVAAPMDVLVTTCIADQLSLKEDTLPLLQVMHTDYTRKWASDVQPLSEHVSTAESRLSSGKEDARTQKSLRDAYYDARTAVQSKITELDAEFFSDLGHALGESSAGVLQLAMLERLMERHVDRSQIITFTAIPQANVNFATVLSSTTLSPDDRAKVVAALTPLLPPLIQRYTQAPLQAIQMERQQAEWGSTMSSLRSEGQMDPAANQRLSEEYGARELARAKAQAERKAATDAAWAAALAVLPEPQRAQLKLAYDTSAYPSIFKDPRSAVPLLERARKLPDLSADQQAQLQALMDTYHSKHLQFCRSMVDVQISIPQPTDSAAMQEYWQRQMESANAAEKIRFDRDEQSQRAVSQLRRILTQAQAKGLPGLGSYDQTATQKTTLTPGVEE